MSRRPRRPSTPEPPLPRTVTEKMTREWIEMSGLTWRWKASPRLMFTDGCDDLREQLQTPPVASTFAGPIIFDSNINHTEFIQACAWMATQPTNENAREEYLMEVLLTYFRRWPFTYHVHEPISIAQEALLARAKEVKEYLQWESLDRTFVIPAIHWRVWVRWEPYRIKELFDKVRAEHIHIMLTKGAHYPFDDGESESESESNGDFDDFAHSCAEGTPPPVNVDFLGMVDIISAETGRVVDSVPIDP
ncbi:hypothetical protein EST38_g13405 [Candolleomyces aberdarensis]|uniref:Uncharacterized protein n=1 Tax=Candolleomyces aberdarensis TaxID=2316362 RepID=A0A4Q2D0R6_9AGAR|nr:hypothetical protein EST38_g13405 [Candolleomyces aberdarensis]